MNIVYAAVTYVYDRLNKMIDLKMPTSGPDEALNSEEDVERRDAIFVRIFHWYANLTPLFNAIQCYENWSTMELHINRKLIDTLVLYANTMGELLYGVVDWGDDDENGHHRGNLLTVLPSRFRLPNGDLRDKYPYIADKVDNFYTKALQLGLDPEAIGEYLKKRRPGGYEECSLVVRT